MNDFYSEIERYINDEANDHNKYFELAKKAPTEKARKILMDIGREEKKHHDFLKEILSEREDIQKSAPTQKSSPVTDVPAARKFDYPTHIENAGLDPDILD